MKWGEGWGGKYGRRIQVPVENSEELQINEVVPWYITSEILEIYICFHMNEGLYVAQGDVSRVYCISIF